jgi:hypothetical protein
MKIEINDTMKVKKSAIQTAINWLTACLAIVEVYEREREAARLDFEGIEVGVPEGVTVLDENSDDASPQQFTLFFPENIDQINEAISKLERKK